MPFQVHNTLTKAKEPFRSLQPGLVRMYNCGPTVYGRAHIGNFRAYLFADTLRRWLECSGLEVRQVMNITDVGHLLDDAEEGEDKIEAQARREKLDPWAISRRHTEQFFADLKDLGCLPAMVYPKASEHIPEMLEMIDGLVAKGYAYQVGQDVYYEVSKFPRYGRLSGNSVEELDAGARIDVREEKRHPADFALWKSDPHHVMKWTSRFGPDGFPGWHIECSAMSRRHLGDRIDIHTGGEDNIFPHHECEIAQTEAFTGEPFATYWMHTKFLQVDGGKMSKRLGNCYSLDDVRAKGFTIRALRFCLIRGHYRTPLNFTWDILREATSVLENLDDLVVRLRRTQAGQSGAASADAGLDEVGDAMAEFRAGMDDDLNVPRAIAALMKLRSLSLEEQLGSMAAAQALQFVVNTANRTLGCIQVEESSLGTEVEAKIRERLAARKAKDFARGDKLRDELVAMGITLEDTAKGVIWKHKASGAGGGPIA
ncbi:MAG: cysteine--tRNA ligase [Planctomycetota bacterium]|nr:cysteine--tRNA ligase [Planctomycetota bacterium]